MMDGAEPVVIQEKSNYYIVISHSHKSLEKVEYDIKRNYHFINRCNLLRGIKNTYAIIVTGIETSPEKVLNQSGFNVKESLSCRGV